MALNGADKRKGKKRAYQITIKTATDTGTELRHQIQRTENPLDLDELVILFRAVNANRATNVIIENAALPPHAAENLTRLFLENFNLTTLEFPAQLFNAEQRGRLNRLLLRNRAAPENAERLAAQLQKSRGNIRKNAENKAPVRVRLHQLLRDENRATVEDDGQAYRMTIKRATVVKGEWVIVEKTGALTAAEFATEISKSRGPFILTLSLFEVPANKAELFYKILAKNRHLVQMNPIPDCFSRAQKSRLNATMDDMHAEHDRKIRKANKAALLASVSSKVLMAGLLVTAGAGALLPFAGVGIAAYSGMHLVIAAVAGAVAYFGMDTYVSNAIESYGTLRAIDAVRDESEKEALQVGLEAEHWSGYLLSYSKLCTYTNPSAFTAGMAHAMNEADEDVKRQIRRLR